MVIAEETTADRTDQQYMARALLLAERGRGRTSPNPMVGALVVDDSGIVVGQGAHEMAGEPHAEIHALAEAGDRARGATLYCTLEPCSHTGRTGPCAPRVVDAGIRRAVVAVEDPNPLVSGRGIDYLRAHGVEVSLGIRRDEAEKLNRPFFTWMRFGRPFVTMKVALSLDGYVAERRGAQTALTGPEASRQIHRERAEVDAIAIGSETLLVDDPLLTARGVYRHRPLVRVIFDRRLRTPASARILTTLSQGPVVIVTDAIVDDDRRSRAERLTDAGAQVEVLDDGEPERFLERMLTRLGERRLVSMIVEGGPALHQAFWRAGLVDRVQLFVTPHTLGSDGVDWIHLQVGQIAGLSDLTAEPFGQDVMIEGYVHRPH